MSNETCLTCRYWTQLSTAPHKGTCRKNPPTAKITSTEPYPMGVFPHTTKSDWCGAWTPSSTFTKPSLTDELEGQASKLTREQLDLMKDELRRRFPQDF